MAGKEEVVLDGVRRSGASARFDGIGVEDEAGEEDAEYFPLSVAEISDGDRSQGRCPYCGDWRM